MKRIKLDSLPSTNSYLAELIKAGKAHSDLVVTTGYQENGKGQGTHSWHSEAGENLLMSLLLHPAFLSASEQFQLSVLTSLALCDLLESFNVNPLIKWPNDIMCGKGKIAGILIENHILGQKITHTIMGIGLNLNQTNFPEFPFRATSLKLETGTMTDPPLMAEKLEKKILCRYQMLKEGRGNLLEQDYHARLYKINRPAKYRADGEEFTGIIRGVDSVGELIVERGSNMQSYGHQEIEYMIENL